MDEKTLWNTVLGELQIFVSPTIFNTWLKKQTQILKVSDSSVQISCQSNMAAKNLEKIKPMIQQSIEKILKRPVSIEFVISEFGNASVGSTDLGPLFRKEEAPTPTSRETIIKSGLTPRMTFESFVPGPNNQLAHAVAEAVVENPGQRYNPFFLYSGVGLGKTHLIQAIGNEILKKHPGLKVLYTTGETFTNELISAIRSGRGAGGHYNPEKFRKKFRDIDVLLIDDVQFLIGKESTQEEFFHTFNTLQMAQKQIVITSDRHPRNFNNLEDRMVSRFSSGMIADLTAPTTDMRIAILREKSATAKDGMPNDVIEFLAERVNTNIRELEGAYNQVLGAARGKNVPVTLELASSIIHETVKEKQGKQINLNDILKAVADYYSVKIADIKGKRRTKELVIPRQMAMYLMYEMTKTPYMTIGEVIGGRDHTTVLHGIRRVEEGAGGTGKVKEDISNIRAALYN